MATLADTIKKLAEKSGIDITTEEFKPVIEAIAKIELPENTDLLSPFILRKDAKNDPEIKNHYYGQFATQFDSAMLKSFADIGLDKEALDEIMKSEPSSFKRIDTLTLKAKEHIAKIADPSTLKGEKAELQKKLDELVTERKSLLEVHDNEKRQLVELRESDKIENYLEKISRDFKLIDIPYKDTIVNQSIKNSLKEHGVKVVIRDGQPVLVNSADTALAAPDGVTFKTVVEKGFANDKLLDLGGDKKEEESFEAKKKETRLETGTKETAFQANLRLAKAAVEN